MINGVLFDMDGTITKPNIDFSLIRRTLGVPEGLSILEHLDKLDAPAQEEASRKLIQYEDKYATESELNSGAVELLEFLKERRIRTGLITRNTRRSASIVLGKHSISFDVIVTREDAPPKPSLESIGIILEKIRLDCKELLMVGDYLYDIETGKIAGMKTVLVTNGTDPDYRHESDYVVEGLKEIITIINEENKNYMEERNG